MTLYPDDEDPRAVYRLLTGAVVPRPIAWVSTLDAEGRPNLAPFSFFTVASAAPAILAIAPQFADDGHGGAREKDTLANLRATGEAVVHAVPHRLREAMNVTAGPWPRGRSEFEAAGLTARPSERVSPPRIAEAPVAMECRLDQVLSWGARPSGGSLVTLRVVALHLDAAAMEGRYLTAHALDPIGRLGGPSYVRVREAAFDLPRFSAEDVRERAGRPDPAAAPRASADPGPTPGGA